MDYLNIASQLVDIARKKDVVIATAESCTGGLIAGAITDIAGSSDVFDRGFVTYSNAAKIDMLGVCADTLAHHGAVSQETAREMAQGAITRSAAQMAVSVTGIAGPGGSDQKPEGRVCFGLAYSAHETLTETMEFGAIGRLAVRQASVAHALAMMRAALS